MFPFYKPPKTNGSSDQKKAAPQDDDLESLWKTNHDNVSRDAKREQQGLEVILEILNAYVEKTKCIFDTLKNIHIKGIPTTQIIKKITSEIIIADGIFSQLYHPDIYPHNNETTKYLVSKNNLLKSKTKNLLNTNIQETYNLCIEILKEICEIYKSFGLEDSIPEFVKKEISDLSEQKDQIANRMDNNLNP